MTVATQSEVNTNLNNDPRGSAQITGMGISGSVTGKHYDVIFTDDIVNPKDRASRAERERTKAFYMELQNIKNRGGRIFNTGTPWHIDDCFSLMPEPKKWDWRSLPEIISEEEIVEIRKSMTPSLFAANYELRHISSDDLIFTSPAIGADPSLIENGEGQVDAAYFGDDYTAFTLAQKHDGKYYVYGRIWRKHFDDVLPAILADCKRFRIARVHMENNADKGYAAKLLLNNGMKALSYHESMNKHVKITTYLKEAWPNVVFVDGTDPLYIDQICDYTEDAEHDDSPDSLSSLLCRARFRVKPYEPRIGKKPQQGVARRVSLTR